MPMGKSAQEDDNLPLHVKAGVIVDAEAFILHAVADKHQWRGDIELRGVGVDADDGVDAMPEDGSLTGRLLNGPEIVSVPGLPVLSVF